MLSPFQPSGQRSRQTTGNSPAVSAAATRRLLAEGMLVGDVLYPAHHQGKEGVGDVGNDDPDDGGLVAAQAAGQQAGSVSQALNGLQHAPPHRFTHPSGMVDHVGYGPHRDARPSRDLPHGDAFGFAYSHLSSESLHPLRS